MVYHLSFSEEREAAAAAPAPPAAAVVAAAKTKEIEQNEPKVKTTSYYITTQRYLPLHLHLGQTRAEVLITKPANSSKPTHLSLLKLFAGGRGGYLRSTRNEREFELPPKLGSSQETTHRTKLFCNK